MSHVGENQQRVTGYFTVNQNVTGGLQRNPATYTWGEATHSLPLLIGPPDGPHLTIQRKLDAEPPLYLVMLNLEVDAQVIVDVSFVDLFALWPRFGTFVKDAVEIDLAVLALLEDEAEEAKPEDEEKPD